MLHLPRASLCALLAVAIGPLIGWGPEGLREPAAWAAPDEDVPVKAFLVLATGWGGHLRFIDNDRGADIGQLDKPRAEERQVALPPGRYRILITDEVNHPVAFADVELGAGTRLVVPSTAFRGLALPPPPPSAAQRVAAKDQAPSYPRGLAARPLTLPAHAVELMVGYTARFTADDYDNANAEIPYGIKWGITDRLEMRDIGLYYAVLRNDQRIPDIGLGAGLTGGGVDQLLGVVLKLSGWFDVKEHFSPKLALQASLQYDATIYTQTDPTLADHHVVPSLTLLYDAASMFTLIAGFKYDWTQITQSVVTQSDLIAERVELLGGFHVSPASWMDFRVHLGPSWARLDGGNWALSARWLAEIRFRF